MEVILINENDKNYIEQIIELEKEVFGINGAIDLWNLKPYIKYGKVYALTERNQVLACSEIVKDWQGKNVYLYGFAVKKNETGRGLGKYFLEKIIEIFRKENIVKIELTVSPENDIAIKLYEKFGFKKIKFLENEYGEKNHRFLYEKTL